VEQFGPPSSSFNRAMLMNVGASEALKQHDFHCFVFHDVDLLPEDDRNLYTCPVQPRHMSVAIDSFLYRYVGGI
jgi:beta-1,4-galactosyltransferase 1